MSKKKYRQNKQHPFSIIALILGTLLILFGILAITSPKTDANAEAFSSSVVPAAVNYAAPELSLQNIVGETKSLTDYRSQVVLVNNWATWCPPCKAEMPTLSAYYNKHRADGFMIVAIEAGDALEGVAQFVNAFGLKFQVWLDPDNASLRAFGNGNLPNSFVIDRAGTVRYAWTGEISQTMLEKYVTPLIAKDN